MKRIIPVVLLMSLLLLVSCPEPEEPVEEQTMTVPISIYDLQGGGRSRAIAINGDPLDANGYPCEVLSIYIPSFAGLGQRTIGSDSKYQMKMMDRILSCTVSEEGNFYIIEGTCNEKDAYVFYKMAKDNSELSFIEARIVEVTNSHGNVINQAIVEFSPRITISSNGVCKGHCYDIEYLTDGSKATGRNASISHEYLYADDSFIGLLYIIEDAPVELSDVPGTEMTRETMQAIANDQVVTNITGPTDGGHLGTILFFRAENNFAFESNLPVTEYHTFDEYKEMTVPLNPNWVID